MTAAKVAEPAPAGPSKEDPQEVPWETLSPKTVEGPGWGDLAEDEASRKAAAAANAGKKGEKLTKIWFVREPKPFVDDTEVKRLEQQFQLQVTRVDLLKESIALKRREKSEAKTNTIGARKVLRQAQSTVRENLNELKPLRDATRESSEAGRKLRNSRNDLAATTEAELDTMIKKMEFRLHHETVPLREEKELVSKLKNLNSQRAKVREYEAKHMSHEVNVDASMDSREQLKLLQKELRVLKEDETSLRQVYQELDSIEKGIDKELEELANERNTEMDVKRKILRQLKAAKTTRRTQMAAFKTNRDFSRYVRKLVADGKVEDAKKACAEQTEEMLEKLKDPTYRKKYLALWETQRKSPVLFGSDDKPVDADLPSRPHKGPKAGSLLDIEVQAGQTKADAVVARALAEASAELEYEKTGKRPSVKESPAANGASLIASNPKKTPVVPVEKKDEVEDAPQPKVSKPSKVATPDKGAKEDTDDFELPEAALKKIEKVVPSSSPKKKAASSNKKDRKKEQAKERRLKAIERKQQREAEEKVRQEEARQAAQAALQEAEAEADAQGEAAAAVDVQNMDPKEVEQPPQEEKPSVQAFNTGAKVRVRSRGLPNSLIKSTKASPVQKFLNYNKIPIAGGVVLLMIAVICQLFM